MWLCPTAQSEVDTLTVLQDPLTIDGVDEVICRGEYDSPIMQTIVQKVKYDFLTAPTEIFPLLLQQVSRKLTIDRDDTAIVPIPLHWRRRLSRGFNQSDYVARALRINTRTPVLHLLQRQRSTTPQAKLNGQDRIMNVTGAFRIRPSTTVPKSIILVDDVITTGSTIKECATVLRTAGVQKISAVALAKG